METYFAPWIVGLLSGLAVLSVFWGLFSLFGRTDQSLLVRVQSLTGERGSEHEQERASAGRREPSGIAARLNAAIRGLWFAEGIALRLARADLALTVPEFVLISIGSAGVLYILMAMVSRILLGALAGALVGLFLPLWYMRRRHLKRLRAFEDQLPDVIGLLVGALRAGFGITQTIEAVARDMPDPTSKEFGRVVTEVRLGASLQMALDNMVRRIDSDDLNLMFTAITVQQEVGGNLAEVLATIADTIRDRIRVQRQIKILTAQQRLSANILGLLPLVLGSALYLLNPDYMRRLFEPGLMRYLLAMFGGFVVAGWVIIRRMANLKV